MAVTREQIVESIRAAREQLGVQRLSYSRFRECSGISQRAVLNHFDRWSDACKEAGVESGPTGGENLIPQRRYTEQECIEELRRVANELEQDHLSVAEFREHGKMHPNTIRRRFNSWENGLHAAGLKTHPGVQKTNSTV